MKKAKKMAEGGISGLGGLVGSLGPVNPAGGGGGIGVAGVGGGGGSAMEGLGTVNKGATAIGSALSRASEAIGGGGGGGGPQDSPYIYKKGGYVDKNGKLNLGSGRVSTASKNKSSKNW